MDKIPTQYKVIKTPILVWDVNSLAPRGKIGDRRVILPEHIKELVALLSSLGLMSGVSRPTDILANRTTQQEDNHE